MRGGDVILLHDGGHRAMGADRAQTVIATENLIRRYKDQGYEFVTVDKTASRQSSIGVFVVAVQVDHLDCR